MTFSRVRSGTGRVRRARRNRRRNAPIWRRVPEFVSHAGQLKRWLRRGVPLMIATAAIAAVATGSYFGYRFVTTSERFSVRVMKVHGNQELSDERVQALAGVVVGDNIFSVELAAVAEAVEAEPMIARAAVRRELPHTLIIEVEENRPVALVNLEGLYLVDSQGRVFKRAAPERGDGADLPVITGLSRAEYTADPEAVQARIREVLAAIELYHSGKPARRRPELGEVNIHPRRGITFITYERAVAVRVGHGDIDALRQRLYAFDAAWQALSPEERQLAHIVYANATTRPDRVIVGFADIE